MSLLSNLHHALRAVQLKPPRWPIFLLNELRPEVPLAGGWAERGAQQRTRLVHSVAVSVEHRRRARTTASKAFRARAAYASRDLLANTSAAPRLEPTRRFRPSSMPPPPKTRFERLPDAIQPKHYHLSLVPDLKALKFDGEVTVEIEAIKQTNEIVLNSIDLEIKNPHLTLANKTKQTPKSINISIDDEKLTLTFDPPIPKGTHSLTIQFTGVLNDKMKGLYRSKYTNQVGDECYAAVTQFEATDARRCFPCWDEPAIKATFDVTLTVPKSLVALSNMPVLLQTPVNDQIKYDFERTPIMSTYLVACVVGEYDYVEDRSTDGVLVRVYTPKGKSDQGQFALEVATKVLPYYKNYFNIAYPLPKIDLIAIADFSAGAMENWGLVTYRETCLLVDQHNTSAASKQWIALVVGHELAHQWFGNLVTMEWWTHLWLNEGYASFVEYLCVDHLFPEFEIWTQFVTDTYIRALDLDSLKNSHPIEVPVGHPSEIDEIFDDISYNKGASVIRMLHNYIGDEDFRKGMHLYLTRHQYKNTFTEDLWRALEDASNKPVADVMSTWTKQMGFPVIQVKSRTTDKGVVLTLTQSKYTADGSDAPNDCIWMIPISITTQGGKTVETVLKTKSAEVEVGNVGTNDWIKVNPGTIGFYRTQYTPEMLEKFIPAIRDRTLPPLDRLGLLDDLFAMVQAGKSSTVEVLKLLGAFRNEDNYTVWSTINSVLHKLSLLLAYTECGDDFIKYQREIVTTVYERLGWNPKGGEKHLDTLLRGLVLGRMSWLDDEHTIKEARGRFAAHLSSSQTLPADLRAPCYRTVLRAGDEEVYGQLLQLWRATDLHEEKERINRAFGVAKDEKILKKVLQFSISDEVRSQDTIFIIITMAFSRLGRDLAWQFFKDNFNLFHDRYKGNLMARTIKYVTENFASEEKALEVETFFKEHDSGVERTVQQSIETIRLNAAWLARDTDAIKTYLIS